MLLSGDDALPNEWPQKKCYKLAWLLNKDFKEYLLSAKKKLVDEGSMLDESERALMARQIAKRAYHMSFAMVTGNYGEYEAGFKAIRRLSNAYYPDSPNRQFNERMYMIISRRISVSQEAVATIFETCEKNLLPLYDAVDHVVNGVKSR